MSRKRWGVVGFKWRWWVVALVVVFGAPVQTVHLGTELIYVHPALCHRVTGVTQSTLLFLQSPSILQNVITGLCVDLFK